MDNDVCNYLISMIYAFIIRWQSLLRYSNWLQSQAQIREGIDNKSLADFDENDNVIQRVNLIETSIIYQSEELQRTKTNFIKVIN